MMNVKDSILAVLVPVRAIYGYAALQNCLSSLLVARKQSAAWKRIDLVVIDDGSDPPIAASLPRNVLTEIVVIKNGRVGGQAGALNHGIQDVPADVYAFTDSDCVVDKDWLGALAAAYATAPCPDAVAGPNWLHQAGRGRWSQWLTNQESNLVQIMFRQYVDGQGRTMRFDCRNFSVTKEFLNRITPLNSPFFVEGAGPSVSGLTSTRWRDELRKAGNEIRFHDELRVRHEPVLSLREEARRYFRWGRNGQYSTLYVATYGSLVEAFSKCHFKRHFLTPILQGDVAPAYAWIVHTAYWIGIALKAREINSSSH